MGPERKTVMIITELDMYIGERERRRGAGGRRPGFEHVLRRCSQCLEI
jgi:hypothetical protein